MSRTFVCPVCGKITLHHGRNMCKACYLKQPRLVLFKARYQRKYRRNNTEKMQEYRIRYILKNSEE